jgi:hypothetical protein
MVGTANVVMCIICTTCTVQQSTVDTVRDSALLQWLVFLNVCGQCIAMGDWGSMPGQCRLSLYSSPL